jgi:uncharacterized membrane protein
MGHSKLGLNGVRALLSAFMHLSVFVIRSLCVHILWGIMGIVLVLFIVFVQSTDLYGILDVTRLVRLLLKA